jgi:hypothetical protein
MKSYRGFISELNRKLSPKRTDSKVDPNYEVSGDVHDAPGAKELEKASKAGPNSSDSHGNTENGETKPIRQGSSPKPTKGTPKKMSKSPLRRGDKPGGEKKPIQSTKAPVREESQISELSRRTLTRYKELSKNDKVYSTHSANMSAKRANRIKKNFSDGSTGNKDDLLKNVNKLRKKVANRTTGIDLATKKLAKEDVDLQEYNSTDAYSGSIDYADSNQFYDPKQHKVYVKIRKHKSSDGSSTTSSQLFHAKSKEHAHTKVGQQHPYDADEFIIKEVPKGNKIHSKYADHHKRMHKYHKQNAIDTVRHLTAKHFLKHKGKKLDANKITEEKD